MRITHHATTVITALILLAMVRPGHAQDNETGDPLEFFGTLKTGYHAYSNDGYRGKVSEYSVPSSGPEASLNLQGTSRNRYFYLESEVLDQDDQTHFLNLDLNRFLQMDLSYMKFNHFLDHDPLTNQSVVTDIDEGENNGITIEELKSGNTIKIPSLPFMKFFANFRQYNKKGSRQATTAAKNNNCSSCHNGTDATGKGPLHVQTTNVCEDCHSSNAWTPVTNVDHNQVLGSCSSCHNGTIATGQNPGHFSTAQDCGVCHDPIAWTPADYRHTGLSYEPQDHRGNLACTACHKNNSEVVNWRYPAFRPDCAGCHAGDYKSDPHKKWENPDTRYTASELRDCTGACHVYTDSSMTRILKNRPGPEHRISGADF